MLNPELETVVVLLVLVGVLCGVAGYTLARLGQRRAGGGKTAAELKTELGEYKENVTEHFQTTAKLLHEMTEQYRSVYEHMASGAQELCDPELGRSQIESLRAGLLPALDPHVANENDAPTSEGMDIDSATADAAPSVEPEADEHSSADVVEQFNEESECNRSFEAVIPTRNPPV